MNNKITDLYIFGRWLGDGTKGSSRLEIARDNTLEEKHSMEDIAEYLDVTYCHSDSSNQTFFDVSTKILTQRFKHLLYLINQGCLDSEELQFSDDEYVQILAGFIDSDGGIEHPSASAATTLSKASINIVLYNNNVRMLNFFIRFLKSKNLTLRLENPSYKPSYNVLDSCYRLILSGSMDTYYLGFLLEPYLLHVTKKKRVKNWIDSVDIHYLESTIPISEIFESIEGEGITSGTPKIFIRVQGCPFRCTFCDTAHSQKASIKNNMLIKDVIKQVVSLTKTHFYEGIPHIEFTGGSPDWYPSKVGYLLVYFKTRYKSFITMQVSGGLFSDKNHKLFRLSDLNSFDYKDPRQKIPFKIPYSYIRKQDEIKFLISDTFSYNFARNTIAKLQEMGVDCYFIVTATTDNSLSDEEASEQHLKTHSDLVKKILQDKQFSLFSKLRILPRQHIIIWGNKRGV